MDQFVKHKLYDKGTQKKHESETPRIRVPNLHECTIRLTYDRERSYIKLLYNTVQFTSHNPPFFCTCTFRDNFTPMRSFSTTSKGGSLILIQKND